MENPKLIEALNAIVIGATGAVGREVVLTLLKSEKWGQIFIPVRRKIDRFDGLTQEQLSKLKTIETPDLDFLSKDKEEIINKFGEEFSKVNNIKIHL